MQIQTNATGWENRTGTQLGLPDAFYNDGTAGIWSVINADTGNNDLVYEIIGECVGSCIAPSIPTATANGLTSVTLNWVSDGDLFDVEWGLSGFALGSGTQINGIATNSTDITILGQTPYQFYVRQNCGVDGESSWVGPINFQTGYCIASSTNTSDVITSFETTGGILNIINNTGTTISPGGYGDFTNMSVAHYATGMINFTANFNISLGFNIWVDWNNNGAFEETEKVYASGMTGNPFSGSFEVPEGDPLGDYTVRIRGQWGNDNPLPCGSISWGEAEDYTLTVIDPPACLPPYSLTAMPTSLTDVTLGWSSLGNNFDLEWGPSGFTPGSGTQINDITTNSLDVTVVIDTPYQFYVRQDCGVDGESLWAGPFNFQTGYCTPVYTNGCSNGAKITVFETADAILNINNETGTTSCGVNGYDNFSNLSAAAPEDMTVAFTVGIGSYSAGVKIWIDWNTNGVFEASELVSESAATIATGGTYTGNFTVPTGTPLGDYRIRVRAVEGTTTFDACSSQSYGETEDYTFTVITPPACLPPSELFATPTSLTDVTLGWSSLGNNFDLEWGPSGFTPGSGTQINDITTNSLDVTVVIDTPYQFYIRQDCGVDGESLWAGPFNFQTGYCTPVYTNGCTNGAKITVFETADAVLNINNVTGTDTCGIEGYDNFSNLAAAAPEDMTVSFTVGVGSYSAGVKVWIDWNGNGEFEASELVAESTATIAAGATFTGSFTVPTGTPLGDYRIRVRAVESTTTFTACSSQSWGETEDYTITVITPPTCMPPTGLGVAGVSFTTADVSWVSDSETFNVLVGAPGFSPTDGTGNLHEGVSNFYTIEDLEPETNYHYYVQADCSATGDGESLWVGPYPFYTGYCLV